jgi:hypothetical protein
VAVEQLLEAAAADAWSKSAGLRAPDEVAFLRSIFDVAVRHLDSALGPSLASFGWSSQTRGIFVHGRPFVAFDPKRSRGGCELGDLLIVVHNLRRPRPAGNALLLQGKLGSLPLAFNATNEKQQWRLYHEWPEFWWRHRFAYHYRDGDGRRHVLPAAPHPGAQYLAIKPTTPSGASFHVAKAGGGYRAYMTPCTFADAIIDTVLRVSGRRFSDQRTAHGRIGWDRVIWDLLEGWAYSSTSMRRRRYQGFEAYRIGPTPPLMLQETMPGQGLDAAQMWSSLPELPRALSERGSDGDVAVEGEVDEPAVISTIFIALSPVGGD